VLGLVNEQLNGRPVETELYILQWKLKLSKPIFKYRVA